jgi:Tol biopolymer transport system component
MLRTAILLIATLLASCSAPAVPGDSASASPTPAPSLPASPKASPAASVNGQLAYVAGVDPQIHLLDLATGESRQLTELRPEHADVTASGPMRPALSCGFGPWGLTWSPDGEHLAFSYGSCDSVVYVVDLDGGLRRIGDGRGPAWAPDGSLIVHGVNMPYCPSGGGCQEDPAPGVWDLRILDLAEDGESSPLTIDGSTAGAGSATWSPDGSTIAYGAPPTRGEGEQDVFGATYVIGARGGEPRLVGPGALPVGWHPDGSLLVSMEDDSSVHAVDLVTGDTTPIGPAQTSTVSPDASLIVTWVTNPVSGAMRSVLRDLDGKTLADFRGQPLAWALDSSALAAIDHETSSILVVGADGSLVATHRIEAAGGGGTGSWRPGS